jgi:hypothetical protein
MVEQAPTPAPKRRWLQFSLRRLLVVVTVVAILITTGPPLYVIYVKWQEQREFDALIDLVKQGKGTTGVPYPYP